MPLSQYGHDVWTSDSGLPQNSITTILQSADGYLWLGTQEGLVRFDGVKFTVFDTRNTSALTDDWVQALLESRDGTLWIGTVTGLARYRAGEFLPALGSGLESAIVTAFLQTRDGSVWVASNLGVTRVFDGVTRTYSSEAGLPAGRVHALAEDAGGKLWVGGVWGAAVLDRQTERFDVWSVRDGFPGMVLSLLPDATGFWAGTGRGLARIEGRTTRLYGVEDGLTHTFARTLARDRHGNLWVGTDGGLFRFREERFVRHGEAEGLSSDRILSLLEDREGSLWVGTSDGGLDRFREQRIATYTEAEGLSDRRLWSVFEDSRGIVWAGTAEGVLNRLAPGSDRFEPVVSLGASVMAIAEDARGDLWIGTRGGGLAQLSGARLRRYTTADGLSGNWVSSVLVDRRRDRLGGDDGLGNQPARERRMEELPPHGRSRGRRGLLAFRGSLRRHLDRDVRRRGDALFGRPLPNLHEERRAAARRRHVDLPGLRGNVLVRDARRALPLSRRTVHHVPPEGGRLSRRRAERPRGRPRPPLADQQPRRLPGFASPSSPRPRAGRDGSPTARRSRPPPE